MARLILTVDDSASMREMVRATLTSAGYQVVEAVDGQEALDYARDNPCDLVISDVNMPRMDGITLVHELRTLGVTTICTAEVMEIVGPTITVPLQGLSDVTDNHILLRFVESGASLYRLMSILKVRDSAFDSDLRQLSLSEGGLELAGDSASAGSILPTQSAKAKVTQD